MEKTFRNPKPNDLKGTTQRYLEKFRDLRSGKNPKIPTDFWRKPNDSVTTGAVKDLAGD